MLAAPPFADGILGGFVTLEDIYYVAQTIAVFLLLVSVVFVGIQIRQNTRATRAASAYDTMKTWGLYNHEYVLNPESLGVVSRVFDQSKTINDFNDLEQAQITSFARSLIQLWTSQYILYKEGSLPQEYWEINGRYAANFVRIPTICVVLEREMLTGVMTADFAAELSRLEKLHRFELSAFNFKHDQT